MLVVHCSSSGLLRGMARWHDGADNASFDQLCGGGNLVITIDPGAGGER
jgi:redox-regulated HSP33 family molecular chaperone